MMKEGFVPERKAEHRSYKADLVVVGGGLSGACAAITAARAGIKVILVSDRPVLGGNASSEIRLWILGATSHMGNNNRWAREGGVVDEILVENTYRNPEGNPVIFDTVLLDKVVSEVNITLLLNTIVYKIEKASDSEISSVTGFCSQNSTTYELGAPLFCDASGDGIIGFLSGAAFRMGAESRGEFGEKFAPSKEYGELLGHSLYFYSKDTGKPVKFIPPAYALKDIKGIPRYRNFRAGEDGCRLWWIEYGGRLDTVHDTETIKWELWKIVYGVWDHIKNSGEFADAETLTLEWVGTIPGKRESRRFEGDYILRQQDVVEQREYEDAIAYGGWALDLHPADGVYSDQQGCMQYHSKGVYQIPYRSIYSRNISNLFLAGRIISATHVAFSSTRVMATCALTGQAAGMAAALCTRYGVKPRDLRSPRFMRRLQTELLRTGHYIPNLCWKDSADLLAEASLSASSELELLEIPSDGPLIGLDFPIAQMIPVDGGIPAIAVSLVAVADTRLEVELRISSKPFNHTPDVILEKQTFFLRKGDNNVTISFSAATEQRQYVFICFGKNEGVSVRGSNWRVSGLLSVTNSFNKAVSNYGRQEPEGDIGVDVFEFWCPQRRPKGHNIAMRFSPSVKCFSADKVANGVGRPVREPNAWVAAPGDKNPQLKMEWARTRRIIKVTIAFDTDFDHPMESSLLGHPENVMPFCVRNYRLRDDTGSIVYEKKDNYQSINEIEFPEPLLVKSLVLEVDHPSPHVPASVFAVRCYEIRADSF
ncbi:MAG TPA: FAD-dependent oxidoreductase [Puia sp.]